MRGQTLGELLSDLKAECGYSQNAAHGINNRESLVQVLKRTQRRLWSDWDWMHLRVSRDIQVNAGQRMYNAPTDLPYERIDAAEVKFGGQWLPLVFGIDERQYSVYDPRDNERSWPIRNWDITEDPADTAGTPDNRGMIEVWPLPSDSGEVGGSLEGNFRLTGIRFLRPLNNDSDRCDLDGDLIVLFAAAEILMRDRKDDAQVKLQAANALYMKLRGNQEKNRSFNLNGEQLQQEKSVEVFAHPVPWSVGGGGSPPPSPAPLGLPYSLDASINGPYVGFRGHLVALPIDVGLVSPAAVGGAEIRHLFDYNGPTESDFLINLLGALPQDHFTQITVNGEVFKSVDAVYTTGAGATQWTWIGRHAGFVDGENYRLSIL